MAGTSSDSFLEKLKSYSNNESFSDVVIRFESNEFKAHTVILSCNSEYFAKQSKESIEKVIHITDFDNSVIEAMLQFIYHFDYTNDSKESAMIFHAKVYQIADKYGIFALKEHAKKKFSAVVKTDWSTDDFPLAIEFVYLTTPTEERGLRDLVVKTPYTNVQNLNTRDGFCQTLRTTADFAADLVRFTCDRGSGQIHWYRYDGVLDVASSTQRGTAAYKWMGIELRIECLGRPKIRRSKVDRKTVLEGLVTQAKNGIGQPHPGRAQDQDVDKNAIVSKLAPKFVSSNFIAKIVDDGNNLDFGVLGLNLLSSAIQYILTATSDDYTIGRCSSK
ncbi:hypothetical protein HG530_015072 [Fusarium avenaceum]|nr:hypothetical protein HG530_015072 [Fusarium avenaceum]